MFTLFLFQSVLAWPPSCLYLLYLETESGITCALPAQASTKLGETTHGASGQEKLLFKFKYAWLGEVPAQQPKLVLLNNTSSLWV